MLKNVIYLLTLSCTFTICYAITADGAEKKCRLALAGESCPPEHPNFKTIEDIQSVLIRLMNDMESAPKDELPDLLYRCLAGVDAIIWIRDNTYSDKISIPPRKVEPVSNGASKTPPKENK